MIRYFSIFLAALFLISGVSYSQNVEDIVSKSYNAAYYNGDDGRATVEMTIVDKQGRTRKRKLNLLRLDLEDGGRQNYYAYFKEPADVKQMVFMVHKKVGGDDDRWMYLPALDLVKRIAASDKRSSFVGSDFLYEDISGRSLEEDKFELLNETESHYLVKATPKKTEDFSYYTILIDKKNYLPLVAEYYNESGKPYRVISALKVETFGGYPTITEMKAENLETKSYTVNEFSKIEYNIGLNEDIFTERFLRRPPRRWLN
jgi:outer membrane lipoprotein-sorting protein